MVPWLLPFFSILFFSLNLLISNTFASKSVCEGKSKYEQCLPKQSESERDTSLMVLDMIFPFAMRITEGTWQEGGTIFASMCMFQDPKGECFTVLTDQHDSNLMHREAGYDDVLWENSLLVPCEISENDDYSKDQEWFLSVTDHANYMLDQNWINTTTIFGPFNIIPAPCWLFDDDDNHQNQRVLSNIS